MTFLIDIASPDIYHRGDISNYDLCFDTMEWGPLDRVVYDTRWGCVISEKDIRDNMYMER